MFSVLGKVLEFSSRRKPCIDCVSGVHWSAFEFSQTFASVFIRLWKHGERVLFLNSSGHKISNSNLIMLNFLYLEKNYNATVWKFTYLHLISYKSISFPSCIQREYRSNTILSELYLLDNRYSTFFVLISEGNVVFGKCLPFNRPWAFLFIVPAAKNREIYWKEAETVEKTKNNNSKEHAEEHSEYFWGSKCCDQHSEKCADSCWNKINEI